MKIGVRIRSGWLTEGDEHLRFLRQIGVEGVGFPLDMLNGYRERGRVDKGEIERLVQRLNALGFKAELATAPGPMCQDALIGRPNAPEQMDKLCQIA